jgi:hypothetical protein
VISRRVGTLLATARDRRGDRRRRALIVGRLRREMPVEMAIPDATSPDVAGAGPASKS